MHIGLISLQFRPYFSYFDFVKPSLTRSTQVPKQIWLHWFEIDYLSPICIQYTLSILSLMVIGHYRHYYGLLFFIMAIILLLDMVGSSKGISRWIHGVFVVIISGFGNSHSIGIYNSCFRAKEMMRWADLCSSNDYW